MAVELDKLRKGDFVWREQTNSKKTLCIVRDIYESADVVSIAPLPSISFLFEEAEQDERVRGHELIYASEAAVLVDGAAKLAGRIASASDEVCASYGLPINELQRWLIAAVSMRLYIEAQANK